MQTRINNLFQELKQLHHPVTKQQVLDYLKLFFILLISKNDMNFSDEKHPIYHIKYSACLVSSNSRL